MGLSYLRGFRPLIIGEIMALVFQSQSLEIM